MKRIVISIAAVVALAAAGCMKKQADGTYRVDNPVSDTTATAKARDNAAKSGDELKSDLRKVGNDLKADAQKAKDSDAAHRAEEKAGDALQKAGEKLKHAAGKTH